MIRNQMYKISPIGRSEVPGTFLLPKEVATTWFCRMILNRGLLSDPPPLRPSVLLLAVDRGLLLEWQAHWRIAPDVEDARKVFPSVGTLKI